MRIVEEGTSDFVCWVAKAARRAHRELPAFPGVAARLVDLLENPDAEISEIQSLVAQDQVVSARVLRRANSVIFGAAMSVESVDQAVLRLGFRNTAEIAMTAACSSLFNMEDRAELEIFPEVWHALWADSLVSAHGGRLLAAELKLGRPERIFLGAMLRNLGALFILKIVTGSMVRGELRLPPTEDDLREAIDRLHAGIGADYLKQSGLPDYVVDIAERHHAVELPFDSEHIDLHVVRLADGLCELTGVSPFASGVLGPTAQASIELFELEPNRMEAFELQFLGLAEQLGELA